MNIVLRGIRTVLMPSLKDCGRLFLDLTMVTACKGYILVPRGNVITLESCILEPLEYRDVFQSIFNFNNLLPASFCILPGLPQP